MHELSIAENIIEISEARARAENARSIRLIKLRLGEFTSVVREALEFSFEVARKGTLAQEASLEIENVPVVVRCATCGTPAAPAKDMCFICPFCGDGLRIVSGDEMQVEYIELD
jgi:hydrogenase nickel incorporation protein HypA/HybF